LILQRITPENLNKNFTFSKLVNFVLQLFRLANATQRSGNRYVEKQTVMQERMILYFRLCGRLQESQRAIQFYNESRAHGAKFSALVYSFAFYGASHDPRAFPDFARKVLGDIAADGIEVNAETTLVLLREAATCGDIASALRYFKSLELKYFTH
jgi:hypothetical protein